MDPGNAEYVNMLAVVALAGRRYDEALQAFQRIAELRGGAGANTFAVWRIPFLRDGSTREIEALLADPRTKKGKGLPARRSWDATLGKYEEVIRSDAEAPAASGAAIFEVALCLVASGNLPAAQERIAGLAPPLRERLKAEPENANVWGLLGCYEAVLGNTDEALRCARKSVDLIPETSDTWLGPARRADLAFVYAWTGDKARAIAEYRRLLQTPGGNSVSAPFLWPNVHVMKRHPAFFPLQSDPRFQALLNDPKNNAPLF
jgi:tetratricopeptide (TPR) repeat protein